MNNTDFLEINDITFTYPAVEGDLDENGKQIEPKPIFEHFSATLPKGFVSFVGQNGCGKTTLMLLASGRLAPQSGTVSLLGQNPAKLDDEQKNLLASVIYQNMEFETEDKVSELLSFVYQNGALKGNAKAIRNTTEGGDLLNEVIDVFELKDVLDHALTHLSKGEIQRVLLAFGILYGSASLFMDEPLFAMEPHQKETALAYLKEYVHKTGTTIYISMHELDLTKKYADTVLLFYPNRDMALGTPEEVLTRDDVEKAYGVPYAMLKDHENLSREYLNSLSKKEEK
ncbi:MAG: ABC transporter ATP-binding protein [Treponema sp.]|uniref:ATP-binding cassette domain-containing protein n=1 Tax=Treponema sp. TaxID=166 RepID=UPI0025F7480C|nr:ABC transporter ATP-binding protein [Treponema sp.]MBR0497235.1 ABC transporter ATP-binding protein [Treponema sp.]